MGEHGPERGGEVVSLELRSFCKKLEGIREEIRVEQHAGAMTNADMVRGKMQRDGIRLESLREMVDTLDATRFEAFSVEELNQIIGLLDYLLLEWDPTFHQTLQQIKDKLKNAVVIKQAKSER